MPVSDNKNLWVSWGDYHLAIERLVRLVYESGWKFDQILCLARGGLRPGDVFSRVFKVPLSILSTSSYRKEAGTIQGELDIGQHITAAHGVISGKVLLIDDLADSGVTLKKVKEYLEKNFESIQEIRSAVIWYKACSAIRPDYYLEYLPDNPWIHQPFEEYDALEPKDIIARIERLG